MELTKGFDLRPETDLESNCGPDAAPPDAAPSALATSVALVPLHGGVDIPGAHLRSDTPERVVRLLAMLSRLPDRLLWNLAFVGGDIEAFDGFWRNLTVPIEEIVEFNSWIPDGVRDLVLSGDVPTIRRLVFVLLLKLKTSGKNATRFDFGIICERAADGTIQRQLPTLKREVELLLRLEAPEEVRLQLLGCQTQVPEKEDTRRYFENCDPWYVRLWRFGKLCVFSLLTFLPPKAKERS